MMGAMLAAVVGAVLLLRAHPHDHGPVSAGAPPSAEVLEFAGSYPEAATPTGVLREVALEAAPVSYPVLFDIRFVVRPKKPFAVEVD